MQKSFKHTNRRTTDDFPTAASPDKCGYNDVSFKETFLDQEGREMSGKRRGSSGSKRPARITHLPRRTSFTWTDLSTEPEADSDMTSQRRKTLESRNGLIFVHVWQLCHTGGRLGERSIL